MNIRLGRMPCAIGWLFCASLVAASPPSADNAAQLVRQLSSEDFRAREAAAAQLAAAGEAAIEPLIRSLCSDSYEAAWRSTAVLQQLALAADAAAYNKIVAALRRENEQCGNNTLSALVTELNARRAAHRRSLAHTKIRAFGGRFGNEEPAIPVVNPRETDVPLPAPPPDLPPEENATKETPVLIADAYVSPLLSKEVVNASAGESLTIDQNWRGGDEGLSPLCDLPELATLNLSSAPLTDAALDTIAQLPAIQSLEIEGIPFSAAALAKFRTRQPRTRVVARASSLLEVSAER